MIGQTISHYKILDKLGEGGMGVVYKAQDTKLDRTVALKFLPAHVSVNEEVKTRFLQEAKAAAALNHANICTIHGVEESSPVPQGGTSDRDAGPQEGKQMFIVMEFIEGGTLRERIPFSKIDDALSLAIQIGEALQEAHSKGIVHRDIKADNIMLTSKGQAKVMDFGLAKLKGSLKLTKTSSTVGTLGYMAPEQIQGGEVDHRSDIFSFGVLLFEMFTGKLPFRGEHEAAMVYSIVNEEPERIQKYVPNASPELQYVIKTALEKSPEDRYQQVSDVVRDLRRLRKQTTRVHTSTAVHTMPQQPSGEAPLASSPALQSPAIAQHKSRLPMYGGIGVVLVLVVIVSIFFLPKETKAPFLKSKFTRMTSSGKVVTSAISPDGRYISYAEMDAGQFSLWVRQIATSSNIQIISPQSTGFAGLTFSPDGNFIYYTQASEKSVIPNLYRIPVLGGTPVKMLSDVQSTVSFSPDGKQIAFVRATESSGDFSIIIAKVDGSGEKILGSHKGEIWFQGDPSWSPDGTTIAAGLGQWKGGYHTELVGIDVTSGAERSLTKKDWFIISHVQWNSSGTGLFVRGTERGSDRGQMYFVSNASGEVVRITNDANNYTSSTTTADGKSLCATQMDWNFKLYAVAGGGEASPAPITDQKDDGMNGLAISATDEIYYVSSQGGSYDIYAVSKNGSNSRQVTSDSDMEANLSLTPDGKTLLYSSNNALSTPVIARVNIDGSGRTQLTSGSEDYNPVMNLAGTWIVIRTWFEGPQTIMKIPANGGERARVSGIQGSSPFLSPDGETVYFSHSDNQSPTVSLYSVPIGGGTPQRLFDLPRKASPFLRWRPKSRQLSYILTTDGVDNIWVCSLNGSAAKQYTSFKRDYIQNFAWMSDGQSLVVSRGTVSTDVILITEEE